MISYLFPPVGGGGVQRALKMTRYLPKFGWHPLVVCVEGIPPGFPRDRCLEDEIPGEAVVERIPEPALVRRVFSRARSATSQVPTTSGDGAPARPGSRVKSAARAVLTRARDYFMSPDEQALWVPGAATSAHQLLDEYSPDAMISTSGPASNHLVALRVAKSTGLPWIADFRDPWVGNMHWGDLPERRRRKEIALEASVAESASAATAVTRAFCDDISRRYPKLPVGLIYNGFDPADYSDLPSAPNAERELTLVYAGALYPRRSPEVMLRALHQLKMAGEISPGEIRVIFAGIFDYPGRSDNRRLVRELDLEDEVYAVGSLGHRAVLELMARADGLLLVGDDTPGAGDYIPGKIYEYLALGKPVLGTQARGEARDILEATGRAYLCDPGDPEGAVAVLRSFLASPPDASGYTPDLHPYRRDHQAAQMAWLLDELVSR